ncbi:MAG: hypothetical protein AAFO74_13000 [Pseudomonadota bacterium]
MFAGNYWASGYWGAQYWGPQDVASQEEYSGTSGGKWKRFKDVKSSRPLSLNRKKGFRYSAYYVQQERKAERAKVTETKKAEKVNEAEQLLEQLASEGAAERAERDRVERLLSSRKRALEVAQIKAQALFAEAERLRQEEEDAIALLLLVN